MAKKFRDKEFPENSFVTHEVTETGDLYIETAFRYSGKRNFDRIGVTVPREQVIALFKNLASGLAKWETSNVGR